MKFILIVLALTISTPAIADRACGNFDYECLNKSALSQIKVLEKDYSQSKKNVRDSLRHLHQQNIPKKLQQDLISVENYVEEIDQIVSESRTELNQKYKELKKATLLTGYRTNLALEEHIEGLQTAIDGFNAIDAQLQIAIQRFKSN